MNCWEIIYLGGIKTMAQKVLVSEITLWQNEDSKKKRREDNEFNAFIYNFQCISFIFN